MNKLYLLFSIILHFALLGISYFNFTGLKTNAIKDTGHMVFDFVTIGPKSKAPVLSDNAGKISKSKKLNKQNTNMPQNNLPQNIEEQLKNKPASNKADNMNKTNINKTNKKNNKISNPDKPKINKTTKGKQKKSISHNNKALVNLNKIKNLNNLINNVLEKEDSETFGANAEEIGDTLTATQIDLVRHTIRKCWHFPAGLKDVESLIVDIRLELDQEGYVRKAETIDKARKKSDPGFRVAAENAERAVLDPACNPLPLPKDKYNEWKNLELSFNPKDMM